MTTPGDIVRQAVAVLHDAVGAAVDVLTDPDGSLRATTPAGRLVVAPGQTISSAWGNSAWDQTVNQFANAADRTNQWPAPNPGSLSFRRDANLLEMYTGTAWVPIAAATAVLCRAYRNGAVASMTSGVDTLVSLDAVSNDPLNMLNTGTLVVPVTGSYNVVGNVGANLTAAADRLGARLFKNGTTCSIGNQFGVGAAGNAAASVADQIQATAGDRIGLGYFLSTSRAMVTGPTWTYIGLNLIEQ